MSGYFSIRRSLLISQLTRVNPVGYKALIDVIVGCKDAIIKEVFYDFKERYSGKSKLNFRVTWDFTCQIFSYFLGSMFPPQFISFLLVGTIGLTLHFLVYFVCFSSTQSFEMSHVSAVFFATIFNFFLNNALTFRLHKLGGWNILRGLFVYFIASSVGLALNVSIAFLMYQKFAIYGFIATLMGVIVDVVWKYTISSHFVWRSK